MHQCEICFRRCKTLAGLKQHVLQVHPAMQLSKAFASSLGVDDSHDGSSRFAWLKGKEEELLAPDAAQGVAPLEREELFARAFVLRGLFSEREAAAVCSRLEAADWSKDDVGREYPQRVRSNQRLICMRPKVTARLWERLAPALLDSDLEMAQPYGFGAGGVWKPVGLNPVLIYSRYKEGEHFSPHRDGAYKDGLGQVSIFTVSIYLNTDFEGGELRLYPEEGQGRPVEPRLSAGCAVVFPHDVLHEGCAVTKGSKLIARTSIMFRRVECLFSRSLFESDPEWLRMRALFSRFDLLAAAGQPEEFTSTFMELQCIQLNASGTMARVERPFPLPPNVLYMIGRQLSVGDLVNASAVSKGWFYAFRRAPLWKPRFVAAFGEQLAQEMQRRGLADEFVHWFKRYAAAYAKERHYPVATLYMTDTVRLAFRDFKILDGPVSNVGLLRDPWDPSFQNYTLGRAGRPWFTGPTEITTSVHMALEPDYHAEMGYQDDVERLDAYREGIHPLCVVYPPHVEPNLIAKTLIEGPVGAPDVYMLPEAVAALHPRRSGLVLHACFRSKRKELLVSRVHDGELVKVWVHKNGEQQLGQQVDAVVLDIPSSPSHQALYGELENYVPPDIVLLNAHVLATLRNLEQK